MAAKAANIPKAQSSSFYLSFRLLPKEWINRYDPYLVNLNQEMQILCESVFLHIEHNFKWLVKALNGRWAEKVKKVDTDV
jgi:hypothetical protein